MSRFLRTNFLLNLTLSDRRRALEFSFEENNFEEALGKIRKAQSRPAEIMKTKQQVRESEVTGETTEEHR